MLITGATPDDVYTITGVSVDAATVAQAKSVIELYTSLQLDDFNQFNARNRFWLQKAICYQAAWMSARPDLFTRSNYTSESQDGWSGTVADPTSNQLAPLALKALRLVGFNRARTVLLTPGRQTRIANRVNGVNGYGLPVKPANTPISDAYISELFGDSF